MKTKKQKRIEPNKYRYICKKNGVVFLSQGKYSKETYNDKFLHTSCDEFVGDEDKKNKLAWKLKKYLLNNKKAVGIASNQLGYSIRAFAIRRSDGCINVFVNPKKIIESGNKSVEIESCLSLKKSYKIERSEKVEFKIKDKKFKFTGYEARVVQHELDHINGTLISDGIHNTY